MDPLSKAIVLAALAAAGCANAPGAPTNVGDAERLFPHVEGSTATLDKLIAAIVIE